MPGQTLKSYSRHTSEYRWSITWHLVAVSIIAHRPSHRPIRRYRRYIVQ
jgi:hypothetical protein